MYEVCDYRALCVTAPWICNGHARDVSVMYVCMYVCMHVLCDDSCPRWSRHVYIGGCIKNTDDTRSVPKTHKTKPTVTTNVAVKPDPGPGPIARIVPPLVQPPPPFSIRTPRPLSPENPAGAGTLHDEHWDLCVYENMRYNKLIRQYVCMYVCMCVDALCI